MNTQISYILEHLPNNFKLVDKTKSNTYYLVYRPLTYKINNVVIDSIISQFLHVGLLINNQVYHYWSDHVDDTINIYDDYIVSTLSDFDAKYFIEVSDDLNEKLSFLLHSIKQRDINLYNEKYNQNIEIFYDLFKCNCEVVANSLAINGTKSYQVDFISLLLYDGQDKNKIDPKSKLGIFLTGLKAAVLFMMIKYPNNVILKQFNSFLN